MMDIEHPNTNTERKNWQIEVPMEKALDGIPDRITIHLPNGKVVVKELCEPNRQVNMERTQDDRSKAPNKATTSSRKGVTHYPLWSNIRDNFKGQKSLNQTQSNGT